MYFLSLQHGAVFATIRKIQRKAGEAMDRKSEYIAVFDSGVGGISVLRELARLMPHERFLYFGDSANAPYGSRTTGQVRSLTMAAASALHRRGIKALVVACNTATAAAIAQLRAAYPDTLVIGIEPALKVAADMFPAGRIGIMATEVTLREEKLAHQLERFPDVQIQRIPAPGLVELIEGGKAGSQETKALLRRILGPYAGRLDALVLGCTHYPFVRQQITEILGPDTALVDGGPGTARQTRRCLEQAGLLYDGPGSIQIENSSSDSRLLALSQELLSKGESL